jgi:hypothetical protein
MPYNFYEPTNQQHFFGGQMAARRTSITNLSAPTPEVVAQADARRTDTAERFGSTSCSHHVWS